ncbi:MAG: hypothetical protein KDB29_08950, partial [Planctomycetes bacterium]|nr:hypothetical protein [Planctomycetota bacterium]
LYITDGTQGGTMLLKDIEPTGNGLPVEKLLVGSVVLFRAFTYANGTELWVSDGTTGGTQLLVDLNPGAASGFPNDMVVFQNLAYFTALAPGSGREIWVSDGTAGGTSVYADLVTGPASSEAQIIGKLGNGILIEAWHPTAGRELWFDGLAGLAPNAAFSGGSVTVDGASLPATIDTAGTLTDADSSDFDTGTMTVTITSNGTANDSLLIENQGMSAGQIGTNATTVFFGGTAIGSFSGGSGTAPLVITFSGSSATPAAAQALMRAVQFDNSSASPSLAVRTIELQVSDENGNFSPITSIALTIGNIAASLQVSTQPSGATGSGPFAVQPVVEVVDAVGQVVTGFTGTVSAALSAGPSAASLSGTLSVNAVSGIATFTDLAIALAGTGYELTFSSGTLATAVSNAFNVTYGTPSQISIVVQPGSATQATTFATQPVIEIQDAGGNRVLNDNTTQITVSIATGTGASGATLSGTTTVTASSGQVVFTNLELDTAGSGYRLEFNGSTFTPVLSNPFNVAASGGTGGGSGGGDEGGCSTSGNQSWLWLVLL